MTDEEKNNRELLVTQVKGNLNEFLRELVKVYNITDNELIQILIDEIRITVKNNTRKERR